LRIPSTLNSIFSLFSGGGTSPVILLFPPLLSLSPSFVYSVIARLRPLSFFWGRPFLLDPELFLFAAFESPFPLPFPRFLAFCGFPISLFSGVPLLISLCFSLLGPLLSRKDDPLPHRRRQFHFGSFPHTRKPFRGPLVLTVPLSSLGFPPLFFFI